MRFILAAYLICLSFLFFGSENELSSDEAPKSILFWNTEEKLLGFKNIQHILPTRLINKSSDPYSLSYQLINLDSLTYRYGGKKFTIKDYINTFKVAGLIVVKDDKILYENYNFGNDETSKWMSFSVTKSVTSMLIGAAIKDGFIKSVNDPVSTYVTDLNRGNYSNVSIEDVLQMSSGIDWNEDYADPYSDVNIASGFNDNKLYSYLNKLEVSNKPGTKFNYNTAESNVIGGIVRAATGQNLSTYLEKKIWQPFGMEFDAYWALDSDYSQELGGCCINATLRDYARIGLFALKNGVLPDGRNTLPNDWMIKSTKPSSGFSYYGYQWWLAGFGYKAYYADGIFGQFIWVDPDSKTVIAMHSARDVAALDRYSGGHRLNFLISLIEEINK